MVSPSFLNEKLEIRNWFEVDGGGRMRIVSLKTSFFLYYNVFLRRIQEEMRIFCMVYIQISRWDTKSENTGVLMELEIFCKHSF